MKIHISINYQQFDVTNNFRIQFRAKYKAINMPILEYKLAGQTNQVMNHNYMINNNIYGFAKNVNWTLRFSSTHVMICLTILAKL